MTDDGPGPAFAAGISTSALLRSAAAALARDADRVSGEIAAMVPRDRLSSMHDEVERRYATGACSPIEALESVRADIAAARLA